MLGMILVLVEKDSSCRMYNRLVRTHSSGPRVASIGSKEYLGKFLIFSYFLSFQFFPFFFRALYVVLYFLFSVFSLHFFSHSISLFPPHFPIRYISFLFLYCLFYHSLFCDFLYRKTAALSINSPGLPIPQPA